MAGGCKWRELPVQSWTLPVIRSVGQLSLWYSQDQEYVFNIRATRLRKLRHLRKIIDRIDILVMTGLVGRWEGTKNYAAVKRSFQIIKLALAKVCIWMEHLLFTTSCLARCSGHAKRNVERTLFRFKDCPELVWPLRSSTVTGKILL